MTPVWARQRRSEDPSVNLVVMGVDDGYSGSSTKRDLNGSFDGAGGDGHGTVEVITATSARLNNGFQ